LPSAHDHHVATGGPEEVNAEICLCASAEPQTLELELSIIRPQIDPQSSARVLKNVLNLPKDIQGRHP
jgi:hypothetical protein